MTLFMKLQESLEEGIEQGITQGDMMRLVSQVRKKCQKGISTEAIAGMLEEEVSLISKISEALKLFPDLTDEQICKQLVL